MKAHYTKHVNQQISCMDEPTCKKCGLTFKDSYALTRHLKRKTPCEPLKNNEIAIITGENEENRCKYCNNTYSTKHNLKRHYATCKAKDNMGDILLKMTKKMDRMQETIDDLRQNQGTTTNIQVNQYNDNRQIIFMFGQGDLEQLGGIEAAQKLLLQYSGKDVIPKMIESMHCNPDKPECHNVYIPELGKNVAMVFKNVGGNKKTWVKEDADEVSKELHKTYVKFLLPGNCPNPQIMEIAQDQEDGVKIHASLMDLMKRNDIDEDTKDAIKDVLHEAKKFHQ